MPLKSQKPLHILFPFYFHSCIYFQSNEERKEVLAQHMFTQIHFVLSNTIYLILSILDSKGKDNTKQYFKVQLKYYIYSSQYSLKRTSHSLCNVDYSLLI